MTETRSALITGLTGQDGSYLAELLLEKGYDVYGLIRRVSTPNLWRIEHLMDDIHVVDGDLGDSSSIFDALKASKPDEVYNLAAQSFVQTSWNQPLLTVDVTALGAVRVLDAVRHFAPDAHFYQASSSEMFGKVQAVPQSEKTPFYPRSPYGYAKLMAHWATVNFRESYDMFACSGILFNHESPRRGLEFVTRKVTDSVARIKMGRSNKLKLGNMDAERDWGFAGDYVRAMHLMLQQDEPSDFVVATGKNHSVRDLVRLAFQKAGINDWETYVETDERFMRPADVDTLLGDPTRVKEEMNWSPRVDFEELVSMMVMADIERWETGCSVP